MANYVVGIAGGIGSGKTAVSDRFAGHGIVVVDADVASRDVVRPGEPGLAAIAERYGGAVINGNGELNRAALRERIFRDTDERRWVERLLHPAINRLIAERLAAATSPYALLVNPLMRARDARAHRILVVDVSEEVQVARTIARDSVDEEQARAIIASQLPRSERLAFADDVIVNDGTLAELDDPVRKLHAQYLELANGA